MDQDLSFPSTNPSLVFKNHPMPISTLRRCFLSALLLLCAGYTALLVWAGQAFTEMESPPDSGQENPVLPIPVPVFTDANPWARPGLEKIASQVEYYRLSGTYQTFTADDSGIGSEQVTSLALVDDLKTGQQSIVQEGGMLGPFTIQEISADRIRISHDNRQWTLLLSGQVAMGGGGRSTSSGPLTKEERFDQLPSLEETAYGKRIAHNQWVISRAAIKGYAEEIIGSPLRATRLYRSFNQVADEEGQTEAGFRLQMKGEQDFFQNMGLQDEDVIRKVNSMKMKNQGRAEYLIGEFMQDKMGLVVLEIERGGQPQKLIYLIRE